MSYRAVKTLFVIACFAAVFVPQNALAANGTWAQTNSGSYSWDDTINNSWTGNAPADGAGFTADFSTVNPTGDITITLDIQGHSIGQLIFGDTDTSSAAGWTIAGPNTLTLDNTGGSGAPTITVNALGTGKLVTLGAPLAGTAGFTKAGSGTLVLTGTSSLSGPAGTSITISGGTLQGTVASIGANDISNSANVTFDQGVAAIYSNSISGNGSLTKINSATLTLSNNQTYTGATIVNGGGLTVNGSLASQSLSLGSGTITFALPSGNPANFVNGTTINGAGSISATAVTGTLALGTITRFSGGAVNFTLPTATGTITANNASSNGILGGYATVAGADFAVSGGNGVNAGAISALTTYTTNTWATGNNSDVTSSISPASGSNTNTLRFNTAAATTVTLSGTNTIDTGGILETATVANNATTITGGTLRGPSGGDLILHQYNTTNTLTIGSTIADNGGSGLVKTGTGTAIIAANSTYAGNTVIGAGTLQVGNGGSTGSINMAGNITNNGTLSFNRSGSLSVTKQISGFGGTRLSGGIALTSDYTAVGAPTANLLTPGALTLAGAVLNILGNANTTNSQTFSGATFSPGANNISVASGASGTTNLALGALARSTGTTEAFTLPASGSINYTSGLAANNLYAGGVITDSSGVMDFAAGNGTANAIVPGKTTTLSTAYSQNAAAVGGALTILEFSNLAVSTTGVTANRTVNQTIFDTSNGSTGWNLNVTGGLMSTSTTGMILVTPAVGAANATITTNGSGHNIRNGGTGVGNLSVSQYNTSGFLTFSSINSAGGIQNGSAASSVTKSGPGTVVITGPNTYTGQTFLNEGVTEISADNAFGDPATAAAVNMNGGTILGNATFALDNAGANQRPLALASVGGGLGATNGNAMTVSGVVSGAAGTGPLVIGIPASSANGNVNGLLPGTGAGTANATAINATGTVVLSNTGNTYTGGTVLASGILQLTNSNLNVLGTGGITLNGGTFQWGSGNTTDISSRSVMIASNGGTLDTNGNSVSLANAIGGGGSGGLTIKSTAANGVLTLPVSNNYSGNTTVNSGKLVITNTTGSATGSGNVSIAAGGSLSGNGIITGTTTHSGTIMPGTVTSGLAGSGTLTLGNLTLNASSAVNFGLSTSSVTNDFISTPTLTLPSSGTVTLNLYSPNTSTPFAQAGTYDLFQYTSLVNPNSLASEFSFGTSISGFTSSFGTASGPGGTSYLTLTLTQAALVGIWTGGASPNTNWSVTGNWQGGTVPGSNAGAVADSARFDDTHATPGTVTLNANEAVGTITFDTTSGSYSVVTGNSSTLTLDGKGAGASIFVTGTHSIQSAVSLSDNLNVQPGNGSQLNISGNVGNASSAKTVTVNGAGTLSLSGNNNYGPATSGTVGTILQQGTLQAGSNTALGAGDVSVAGNSTLQAGVSIVSLGNNVVLGNAIGLTLDSPTAKSLTLTGVISDTNQNGSLTKTGAGTVVLAANNTYSGSTTIKGGILSISTDSNLGTQPAIPTSNSVVLNGGSLLATTSFELYINRGIGIGSTSAGDTSTTTALIDVAPTQTFTYNGVIASAGNNGTNNLTVNSTASGGGILVLGGANTFNGVIAINAGVLQLANSLALQNSTLNYNNQGGTLSFGGQTAATLSGLTGSQNLPLKNDSSAAVALTISNTAPANSTYAGGLTDVGSLTKSGSGTLTLTGPNNYSGNTLVSNGVLVVGAGGTIGVSTSTITAQTGGQFQLNGGTATAFRFSLAPTGGGSNSSISNSTSVATFTNTNIGSNGNTAGAFTINDGTVSLGVVDVQRDSANNTTPNLNTGLRILGGTVTATSIQVSNGGSGANLNITGGSLTIGNSLATNAFRVGESSSNRGGWLTMSGGTLTYLGTDGLLLNSAGGGQRGIASITGATSLATLAGVTVNAQNTSSAANSTLTVGTGATLYLGSVGLVVNQPSGTVFAAFGDATIGAFADWTSTAPITLNGTTGTTFQAADASNVSHDISLGGALTGTGNIIKTGSGTLTLTGTNGYGGNLTVNAGNLRGNTDGLVGTITTTASNQTVTIDQGTVVNGGSTSAAIGGPGSVVKTGANTATLSNVSGYSGTTTISQGSLTLGTTNAINQTSQVIMAGGTLVTGGTVQDFTTSGSPATLKVTANSTIDLGGSSSLVKFASSNGTTVPAAAWSNGVFLRVSGWTGTPVTGASDPEQLIIGTDTSGLNSDQLNHIHFTGYYTGAAFATAGVAGEVVPNTAPILKGDVNQDGSVSVADISALMAALTNISGYETGSLILGGNFVRTNHATALDLPDTVDVADIDGDNALTNLDIQAEISLVANLGGPGPGSLPAGGNAPGGVTAVPEPTSFVLLALGGLALACRCLQCRMKGRRNWISCYPVFAAPIDK